jgi:flagellar motor switch protein FliM
MVAVLGRKGVTVKDLLGLRMGQVVELDKMPGEAIDLVASGKIIGKGELVEVDGKLGVRVLKLFK